MDASVEISMYPLKEQYETPILEFIQRLNSVPGLSVETNSMSTQIFGDYDLIFDMLKDEMKNVLSKNPHTIFVIKSVGINLNN